MSVAFEELDGSPSISLNMQTGDALGNRSFKILWADYPQFVVDIAGKWIMVGTTPTYVNARVNFPGWPQLLADDVQIKRFGGAPAGKTLTTLTSDTNSYTYAQVDVTYKPRTAPGSSSHNNHPGTPDVPAGTFLELESDVASERLALALGGANTRLFWHSDNVALPPDTTMAIPLGTEEFTLTWSRVPFPPWSQIKTLKGQINSGTFLGLDAKTVMFLGARRKKSFQINDKELWTVTYKFKARSQPWDQMYRSDAIVAGFQQVEDLFANPLFTAASFSPLFSFGS